MLRSTEEIHYFNVIVTKVIFKKNATTTLGNMDLLILWFSAYRPNKKRKILLDVFPCPTEKNSRISILTDPMPNIQISPNWNLLLGLNYMLDAQFRKPHEQDNWIKIKSALLVLRLPGPELYKLACNLFDD